MNLAQLTPQPKMIATKEHSAAKPQPRSRGEDDVCQRMKSANGFFDGKFNIS